MYWFDTSDPGRLSSSDRQVSFWCDTPSDIANLPTSSAPGVQQGDDTVSCKPVDKGSSCICISTSEMYVLNSNDVWTVM